MLFALGYVLRASVDMASAIQNRETDVARIGGQFPFNPVELALKKHGFNLVRQSDRHRIFKKQRYHGHGVLAGRG